MLVNPNLIIDSVLDNPEYWSSYKDFKKDGSIVTAIYDRPVALGLIFATSEELKANTDYTLSIYAKGTEEFSLNYNYFMYGEDGNLPLSSNGKLYSPNVWHRIVIPMKHNKNNSFKNIMVGYNHTGNGAMEISFKYPKFEIGLEATPYIPSENSLNPSKQAVFKAGGGIQRSLSTLIGLGVGYVS